MTIKSEDVRPERPVRKTTRTTTKTSVATEDSNFSKNDAQRLLEEAMENYESSLKEMSGGKILLKMERENASFTTTKGVKFSKDHPYQLVDEDEVAALLRQNFRKAYPEEIKDFYSK